MDFSNRVWFCTGYNTYVIEKARLWDMHSFQLLCIIFVNENPPMKTMIILEARVDSIGNTINNIDLNVIETVFHDMFSVRCEFQVKLWKHNYKLT